MWNMKEVSCVFVYVGVCMLLFVMLNLSVIFVPSFTHPGPLHSTACTPPPFPAWAIALLIIIPLLILGLLALLLLKVLLLILVRPVQLVS